jgi:hypothetical protein
LDFVPPEMQGLQPQRMNRLIPACSGKPVADSASGSPACWTLPTSPEGVSPRNLKNDKFFEPSYLLNSLKGKNCLESLTALTKK